MEPRERKGSGLESGGLRERSMEDRMWQQLVEMSGGGRPNFKEGGSLDRNGMNLQTSQESVYGGWMRPSQRSMEDRMWQLVEMSGGGRPNFKEGGSLDRNGMNLQTSQESVYGGWMRPSQRSREGVFNFRSGSSTTRSGGGRPNFKEGGSLDRDGMNLQTSQESVYGGWMRPSQRSGGGRPNFKEGGSLDRDGMNLRTSQKSDDGDGMSSSQRSREGVFNFRSGSSTTRSGGGRPNFKEGGSLDRDGMNLRTSQKSDDGDGMSSSQSSREDRMQQQLVEIVSVENQHCASTESDGRDGHTEELKEGKSSVKKMVGDAVKRLVRRVSKNTGRRKEVTTVKEENDSRRWNRIQTVRKLLKYIFCTNSMLD